MMVEIEHKHRLTYTNSGEAPKTDQVDNNIGTAEDVSGMLSLIISEKTEKAKSKLTPIEILSPDSVGSLNINSTSTANIIDSSIIFFT
jgi:hypothetical protein